MGAGDLVSVGGSAAAASTPAAQFQAAVSSGGVAWRDCLLQIMQEGSHAQTALVCQIWTSLLSRQALAKDVNLSRISGAIMDALSMHVQHPLNSTKEVCNTLP